MRQARPKFKEFPSGVKRAMLTVFAAWCFFIGYNLFITGTVSIFHLTMGMLVCFAIFSLKTWTRLFVIIYNIIMAFMIGFELYYLLNSGGEITLSLMSGKIFSIILFALSSFFLFSDDVKSFFTEQNS